MRIVLVGLMLVANVAVADNDCFFCVSEKIQGMQVEGGFDWQAQQLVDETRKIREIEEQGLYLEQQRELARENARRRREREAYEKQLYERQRR